MINTAVIFHCRENLSPSLVCDESSAKTLLDDISLFLKYMEQRGLSSHVFQSENLARYLHAPHLFRACLSSVCHCLQVTSCMAGEEKLMPISLLKKARGHLASPCQQ